MKRRNISLLAVVFVMLICCGCKKSAPYINDFAGTYKVSGTISLDTIVKRTITDSLVVISKVNNTTLQFIEVYCDTSLTPVFNTINLSYNSETGDAVMYSVNYPGHSPSNAVIFFHNPPNGSFTFEGDEYCSPFHVNTDLSGLKVN